MRAKPLVGLALIAVFAFSSRASAAPALDVDPAAEAEACAKVVAERPKSYDGRGWLSELGQTELQWLAEVAFRLAYARWAETEADRARVAALEACVLDKLPVDPAPKPDDPKPQPDPQPEPKPDDPKPLPEPEKKVTDVPTPGAWYHVKWGDTLSSVAKKAYGTKDEANFEKMKAINAAAYNQRFFRKDAADNLFPDGRISFNPRFGKTFQQQQDDPVLGGEGGKTYAWIYFPPK